MSTLKRLRGYEMRSSERKGNQSAKFKGSGPRTH